MLRGITDVVRHRWRQPQGYRDILYVGFPLIVGMSSATIMEFIDRVFLANYSTPALAAAMPAALVFMTVFLTVMGVSGYTTVLIAQYIGSNAPHRVGSALWQGIWCSIGGGLILFAFSFAAKSIFAYAGHPEDVQELEVIYFSMLCHGGFLGLLNVVMDSFFSGRGQTRPVLVANVIGALVKIPADYLFIFGSDHIPFLSFLHIPSLGIVGAGIGTYLAWITSLIIMGLLVFTQKNEKRYRIRSSWQFSGEMFKRLLKFGLPNGVNFFMDIVAITWFSLEVGTLGTISLAASNIAFSLNSLIFVPMLGMNFAISSLVGQSMGSGKPKAVEALARNSLELALAYMLPLVVIILITAEPLVDLFSAHDLDMASSLAIKKESVILIYFIAVYSTVDAATIVYLGVLKGAGDTLGILRLLVFALIFFLVLPIMALKAFDMVSLYNYWYTFTVYCIFIALGAILRFKKGTWRTIRVVETAVPIDA